MRRCEACGRLSGKRARFECPCLRAINPGALVVDRLHNAVAQAKRLYTPKGAPA